MNADRLGSLKQGLSRRFFSTTGRLLRASGMRLATTEAEMWEHEVRNNPCNRQNLGTKKGERLWKCYHWKKN